MNGLTTMALGNFKIVWQEDYIEQFTDMFADLATKLSDALIVIVPAAFGLFAFKYVWRMGKSFFTSLSR